MTRIVTAVYDATQNALRLDEPLDGVRDHEMVQLQVTTLESEKLDTVESEKPEPAWIALRGSLSKEAGEELSRVVNELFPPWD